MSENNTIHTNGSSESTKMSNHPDVLTNGANDSVTKNVDPASTNPKAIWSLVLGILSITCCYFLTGIPGWILGAAARKEIRASGQQGTGVATAGYVLSIIGTILSTLVIIIYVGIFVYYLIYRNENPIIQ